VVTDRPFSDAPRASPGHSRSLASRVFAINDDIWTYDIASGAPLRFTFEPLDEIFPQWTADGARLAYGTRTGTIF
jgi:hypothetical protein